MVRLFLGIGTLARTARFAFAGATGRGFVEVGDIQLRTPADVTVRVVEVVGSRQQIRVRPDRVATGDAPLPGQALPDVGGLA